MKISGCSVVAKDGRYYVLTQSSERSPAGRIKRRWTKLTRVDQGEPALLDALAAFKRGHEITGDLPAATKAFLSDWAGTERPTPAVKREYERMFGVIAAKLKLFHVHQVRPADILTFLKRFNSTPTARRAYKARLSTFFSWAVIRGMCKVNPCREIKLKAPPKRKGQFNPAVWFAIYDEQTPIVQCFMDLCFLTTARPTEIRLLDEAEIGDVIHFAPTKTEESSGATVDWPVTPEIKAVLERARSLNKRRALPGQSAPVIQMPDGHAFSTRRLYDRWTAGTKRAGHKGVTTRDIRPYALAEAERNGATLRELQTAAAHTTSATTEGYLDQYRQVVSPVRMTLPKRNA